MHTLPTGFIEYGQPPSPPIDESTTLIPKNNKSLTESCSRQNIFNSIVKSVMEMNCQSIWWELFKLLHQFNSFLRCSFPDSISQWYFVTTQVKQLFSDIRNFWWFNFTFIRAAHNHWNVSSDFDVVFFSDFYNRNKSFKTFFDWTVKIFLREWFCSWSKYSYLFYFNL